MRQFARIAGTVLISGILLSQLVACERASESMEKTNRSYLSLTLSGAGSSFAAPIFIRWALTDGQS